MTDASAAAVHPVEGEGEGETVIAQPGHASPNLLLAEFEGPLDLLLHLCQRNEFAIVDLPIAPITEQYLACLDAMRELDLAVAGEFLAMAATLCMLKSRELLPRDEEEREDEEQDPRSRLIQQLLEYQRFRQAARELAERPRLGRDLFARQPGPPQPEERAPLRASLFELVEAFRGLLRSRNRPAQHAVETDDVDVGERMREVLSLVRSAGEEGLGFEQLFPSDATRRVMVATFLGILELVRLQAIRVRQERPLGPIALTPGAPIDLDRLLADGADASPQVA